MKPQWDSQIEILNNALAIWEQNQPDMPSTFTYQGTPLTTNDLDKSLREMIGIVQSVASCDDIDPMLFVVHQQSIINIFPQIQQAINNLMSNPQVYLEQLISFIWSVHSSIVWLIPPNLKQQSYKWTTQTAAIGKMESTEALLKRLTDSVAIINNSNNIANQSDETVRNLLTKIEGYEREAANAKTNAETSSSQALLNKEAIQNLLSDLEIGKNQQQELLAKINLLSEDAQLVREGNLKAGLAASFGSRRTALERSQTYWVRAFFIGITLLILGALLTTTDYLKLQPLINENGLVDAWGILARVLITGPAVWFTWFVARQYGNTMRLIEDYAFKEASALAFIGYRREMEGDEDMIKLLRETAIKNFGSPPTRMLAISEPSSPLHELVDKALHNKGGLEKITELIKSLMPNGTSK
ncbi:hypothetical protein [Crenothrix sp.]|uniref:hypothetical protein n=1 Tax=Crenothrix sp. TaxID=3100433 RepID=UPI00374D49F0